MAWVPGGSFLMGSDRHDPEEAPARRVSVPVVDGTARLLDAVGALAGHGISVDDLALRHPTLDEVFLTLTGRPARALAAYDGR